MTVLDHLKEAEAALGEKAYFAAWFHVREAIRLCDSDGTHSAETACPAPVPQDCQARAESIAQTQAVNP